MVLDRRSQQWLVVVVALVVQATAVFGAEGPIIYADELGHAATARYFGVGTEIQMLAAFSHFGYGFLLAPLTALFTEPDSFYRAATIVNSLTVVASAGLLHRVILIRFLGVGVGTATAAAIMYSLAPPLLINTSIMWPESVLIAATTVILAALLWFRSSGSRRSAVALGLSAVASYAIHPRALVLLMVVVGALVVLRAQRIVPLRSTLLAVSVIVVGYLVVGRVNDLVFEALYTEGSILQTPGGLVTKILEQPDQWLGGLLGTAWYQILGTGGLLVFALLGWGSDLVSLGPRFWVSSAASRRVSVTAALFLGGAVVGTWLLGSVIAIADEPRIDQLFYGRYSDFLGPLAMAFGVIEVVDRFPARGRLVRGATAAVPVVGLVAVGSLLAARRGDDFFVDRVVVRPNVPVLSAMEHLSGTWDPTVTGLWGAAVLAVAALLGWRSTRVALAGVALTLAALSAVTLTEDIWPASELSDERTMLAAPLEDLATGGTVFLAAPYEVYTLYGLQYWADDVQFALETECPTASWDAVIASPDDPRFSSLAIMADDAGVARQLLSDVTGTAGGSRSAELMARDRSSLTVTNLDTERPLLVSNEPGSGLVLWSRWFTEDGITLVHDQSESAAFEIAPGVTTDLDLGLDTPPMGPGVYLVRLDLRTRSGLWLSESRCGDSVAAEIRVILP